MSFYRKYRPQLIDEIDNAKVRTQLLSLLTKDTNELPHAFFLTGPKGTGKTTTARLLAKLFNCQNRTPKGPCGACPQCSAISMGNNLDVVEMDAASNRGIDEIRQLKERIGLSPVSADFTVYIVDEVHMLTTEAFNALLKTLEEPPNHAVFILATTDAHKVPGTIKSRCMLISFAKAGESELTSVVMRIANVEKLAISESVARKIATLADGSFRDAAKLLEQVSLVGGEITDKTISETLQVSDEGKRSKILEYIKQKDAKSALSQVHALVSEGQDMKELLSSLIADLHEILLKDTRDNGESGWDKTELIDCIRRMTLAFDELRFSPIAQLPIELAIIEYTDTHATKTTVPVQKSDENHQNAADVAPVTVQVPQVSQPTPSLGLLTMEKLVEHWSDFIAATKPLNHSVAGVLRSSRPKMVKDGIVTIEAFYKFHQEKLVDAKTKQVLSDVLKKLFGERVKIDIVLGKK